MTCSSHPPRLNLIGWLKSLAHRHDDDGFEACRRAADVDRDTHRLPPGFKLENLDVDSLARTMPLRRGAIRSARRSTRSTDLPLPRLPARIRFGGFAGRRGERRGLFVTIVLPFRPSFRRIEPEKHGKTRRNLRSDHDSDQGSTLPPSITKCLASEVGSKNFLELRGRFGWRPVHWCFSRDSQAIPQGRIRSSKAQHSHAAELVRVLVCKRSVGVFSSIRRHADCHDAIDRCLNELSRHNAEFHLSRLFVEETDNRVLSLIHQ
jgi:hypothetical protein